MMNEYISEMVAREDKSTAEHSGRVARIAVILGRALKPAKLTDEEFAEIKKHTVYGFAMISPEDNMIAGLILSHRQNTTHPRVCGL